MSKNNYKNQQPTVLVAALISIFKALWWLVSLPFKGLKFGAGRTGLSLEDKNYIVTKRQEIEGLLNSQNVIELKHAVMEADKLADYTLKAQGYSGETFADRLRGAEKYVQSHIYNDLWQGHKVRNQIAHESGTTIHNSELSNATRKLLNYIKMI